MKYVDLLDVLFSNGIVPVANGGTNANNLAQAQQNLGITVISKGTSAPPTKGTPNSLYIQYK